MAALLLAPSALAQGPITIGEQHLLAYGEEAEPREINVYLPAGYAAGDAAYPVLYLLDGGLEQDFLHVIGSAALNALWGRSQAAIVVGIETRDRRAELIGTSGNASEQAEFPTAGDAVRFRAFIREAVQPMIAARYHTNGIRAVLGESLAGLFIVETWLTEPELFDAYGAVNPSLWWQDQALARSAAATLADGRPRGPLLLSYSNEGEETEAGIRRVASAAGAGVCLLERPDLTHATAFHSLNPAVLQYLLPTEWAFEPEWGFTVGCRSAEEGK